MQVQWKRTLIIGLLSGLLLWPAWVFPLEHDDVAARLESLRMIRDRGQREAAPELLRILESLPPSEVQLYRGLMTLLGEWREPGVLPIAADILDTCDDQRLIDGAAYALGQLGDLDAVTPLRDAIAAGRDRRLACRDALRRLIPDVRAEFTRVEDLPGVEIEALATRPDKSGRPALEVGDVIYNQLSDILPDYDHAALYVGRVVSESGFTDAIIESRVLDGVEYASFIDLWDGGYLGRYTVPGLDFTERQAILATARELVAANIGYPNIFALPALEYVSSTPANTRITIPWISGLRCDGVVEYCYEFNGIDVWDRGSRAGDHFDISYNTDWADEHNDSPAPPLECDREFAPIAQRGGCDNARTNFQPAQPARPPRVMVHRPLDSRRITITAVDELSGIYSLEWAVDEGDWRMGPIQGRYPESNSQTVEVALTSSAWISTRAVDNAGNVFTGKPCYVELNDATDPKILFYPNRPNPFNAGTMLVFLLPDQQRVSLKVFDLSGRLVRVLLDDQIMPGGRNDVFWDGRDAAGRVSPTGVYFGRLQAGHFNEIRRMTLLK
jgi:PBS lyase HEAT-like repeat